MGATSRTGGNAGETATPELLPVFDSVMEIRAKNRFKNRENKKWRVSMLQTSPLEFQRETLEAVEVGPPL
jgi:hypothetical protein